MDKNKLIAAKIEKVKSLKCISEVNEMVSNLFYTTEEIKEYVRNKEGIKLRSSEIYLYKKYLIHHEGKKLDFHMPKRA